MISVRFHRGLELPDHALWLDPWESKPFAFVSHAHSDHIGNHSETILSAPTARLMRARLAGRRTEHVLDFGVEKRVRGMRVTLLPAGHIFGSAQFFLEEEGDSLLYTGDFKLRPGLSSEAAEWRQAGTLIMETTFGMPKYRFPPTGQVMDEMVRFCQGCLEEDHTPVLLGYSLGKSQEILCALSRAGLTPMLHGSVFKMTEIYRSLQPDFPCGYVKYDPAQVAGKVLVCPPSAARTTMVTRINRRRTAVLTGWAIEPGAKFRYGCDAAFPLSDHADYDDLVRYVELVQPRRVLTLHGFAAEFAADLRRRGFEAWALTGENQLELQLAHAPRPVKSGGMTANAEPAPAQPGSFAEFAALGEQIAGSASRLKKIELLAAWFAQLSQMDARMLAAAALFLTGRAFAQCDARVLNTGWAVIKRALLAASGITEEQFREVSHHYADAGKTARDILEGRSAPEPFTLLDARAFLDSLETARGPIAKKDLLEPRLARITPLEAKYLVNILTGELRIGLKEGLVEEAVAAAFHAPLDEVREAGMLLGDIGEVAIRAARGTLAEVEPRLFTPLKVMLASPEPDAGAIWERLCEAAPQPVAWVEDKFDGIRAHLHRSRDRVEIFSRDLKRVTGQFEELARAARDLSDEVIFDGEIVAYEHGRRLGFQDLQKRLGRKGGGDFFLGGEIPVRLMVFDLLWLNGASLLKEPLRRRRELLESLALPPAFERVPVFSVRSAAEIDAAFDASRARSNEGLMVKDAESLYTPGRRGLAWLKLKKELATLDVVVVGAEYGHGKRSGVLSDYTFAIRNGETLLTIGKAYSGLTDAEIAQLTGHFLATTLKESGRYREVIPDTVLEIAFDRVQESDRHASGLALRFPRIKSIRRDKTVEEIDTLETARKLVAPGYPAYHRT
ncbi:MAG TPA: ATP-dependent DNA ligase [Chthoniobacteraceae bacterium]|nr:ATP-dependent DNA ligase [Chthoniobacteraceae bacterium]